MDTGDALTGLGTLGDDTQGKVIVKAMNMVGYDAMALGVKELELGRDVLAQRLAELEFAVVSANAEWKNGAAVVPPYVILDVGDHRVGVIGLTNAPDEPRDEFVVTDPAEALARLLPEVSERAHVIVVLTSLDPDAARALAQSAPGVDIVVAANAREVPADAERVGGGEALLVVAEHPAQGHTGRQVGRLAATLEADGNLTNVSWASLWLGEDIADDKAMGIVLDAARRWP